MIKKITAILSIAALVALPACCWSCKNKKTAATDIQKEVVVKGEVAATETSEVNKF